MTRAIAAFTFFLLALMGTAQEVKYTTKFDNAVPVLNVGTFHMGYTSDANKTEFDEHNKENVRQVHEIAKMIAKFKPTVIIVETTPAYQEKLEKLYAEYLKNPGMKFEKPDEVELLAYEVGRLSGTKMIYGIDYKEEYNYAIYNQIANKADAVTCIKYERMMDDNEKKYMKALGREPNVLDMLKANNQPDYLDFLINVNADMLTYVSSKGNHEGADEAAKFYHRNLVMYSNLNQVPLTKDDRVFILMGATHTAYFNEFMKRSPKYKLVNVFDYLK